MAEEKVKPEIVVRDILKIEIPEEAEVEVYLVRLPTGVVVARTKEELEKVE